MRYTKIGTASYVVTALLIAAAIVFASWRGARVAAPRHSADVGSIDGREAFRGACASCHPDAAQLGAAWAFPGGARSVAALLLEGEARFTKDGSERAVRHHPTFVELPDERLAAIINFVGGAAHAPGRPAPESVTPADFRRRR